MAQYITKRRTSSALQMLFDSPNGIGHDGNLLHLCHIVHSHHIRAASYSRRDCCCRAPGPFGRHLYARDGSNERLSRRSHEPRQRLQARPSSQVAQAPQQLEVLLRRLGEAESRVQHDAPSAHTRGLGGCDTLEKLARDSSDDSFRILGHSGHGGGRAAHVHQADGRSEPGRRGQHVWVEHAGRHVVDDVGSGIDSGLGDVRAVRVDADGDAGALGHGPDELDGGKDPRRLFFAGDLARSGSGGLAAHVEDGGTAGNSGLDSRCEVGLVVGAAVREGVGRDVEDGHDARRARRR